MKDKIRGFLEKNKKNTQIGEEDDLFAKGFVDSLFALKLIMFLEKEFKIKISNKEISQDNFRSISRIAETVERLGGGSAGNEPKENQVPSMGS